MPAGTALVNSLALRVRDVTNFAYSRTFLLETLNRCNRALNAATQADTNFCGLIITPGRALYKIPDDFTETDILRVLRVEDGAGREIMRVGWESLVENDPEWLHRVGPRPEVFACLGRDLLAIMPAPSAALAAAEALTVFYVRFPADLLDDAGEDPAVPFERSSILLDLAEVVVYLRGRIFEPASAIGDPLKRVSQALGIEFTYGVSKQAQVVP